MPGILCVWAILIYLFLFVWAATISFVDQSPLF